MKLRLSRRARQDLDEIGRFLVPRSRSGARRVKEAIQDAFEVIANHPQAGRLLGDDLYRLVVPRLPYLIFYRFNERDKSVDVITIRHSAQAPDPSP